MSFTHEIAVALIIEHNPLIRAEHDNTMIQRVDPVAQTLLCDPLPCGEPHDVAYAEKGERDECEAEDPALLIGRTVQRPAALRRSAELPDPERKVKVQPDGVGAYVLLCAEQYLRGRIARIEFAQQEIIVFLERRNAEPFEKEIIINHDRQDAPWSRQVGGAFGSGQVYRLAQDKPATALNEVHRAGHQTLAAAHRLPHLFELRFVLAIVEAQHALIARQRIDHAHHHVGCRGDIQDIGVFCKVSSRSRREFGLADVRVLTDDCGKFVQFEDRMEYLLLDPFTHLHEFQRRGSPDLLQVTFIGQRFDAMTEKNHHHSDEGQNGSSAEPVRQGAVYPGQVRYAQGLSLRVIKRFTAFLASRTADPSDASINYCPQPWRYVSQRMIMSTGIY